MASATPSSERAEFPARLSAVPDTAAFVQHFCDRNGVSRADALRLRFVIEELFTNTVRHGYGGESASSVRIGLAMSGRQVVLSYEDSAPRYDPLGRLSMARPELGAAIEDRPIDGLGLYILGQLLAGARYAYENGCNRLWFTLPREG